VDPWTPLPVINIYPAGSTGVFSRVRIAGFGHLALVSFRRPHWGEPFRCQQQDLSDRIAGFCEMGLSLPGRHRVQRFCVNVIVARAWCQVISSVRSSLPVDFSMLWDKILDLIPNVGTSERSIP